MTEVNATVAPAAAANAAPAPVAPKVDKPAVKAIKARANGAKAPAKAAVAAKGKAKVAETPAKRSSRIAPVQERLLLKMQAAGAKGVGVAAMAETLGCTEREVRLAIDRARANAVKIDRVGKGVFAFAKGFKFKAAPAKA